jgi:enoyl-CoA hydratase
LGFVTHCIESAHFAAIRQALADADPIDPILDDRHERKAPGELTVLREVIARCFGQPTVEEIIAALKSETGSAKSWAETTLATLATKAPASLKITLQQLRIAGGRDLKDALELEYRMASHCMLRPDFQAAIATASDGAATQLSSAIARWTPSTLSEVTPDMVDEIFALSGARELVLPPRPQSLVALA